MSTNLHDRYNKSSIRMTKASVPHFYDSGDDEKNSSEGSPSEPELGGLFAGLKPNWAEPMIMKNVSENRNNEGSKRSFSATGSVYSNASYAPNKIEVESFKDDDHLVNMLIEEHPLIAFKNRRHGRDCCFRFQMFFVAFYKLAFLRSSLPPKYPLLNLSILVILLFLDIAAALMLFLLYEHEANFQIPQIPYLFIYPFTIIIAPIMALASIFICKASFYRVFLNTNALTCTTNIFLTLLIELVFLFLVGDEARSQLRSTDTIEPIILLLMKIALKIMLAYFACKQLAFNNNSSFFINKSVLEKISKKIKPLQGSDCATDIFKRGSEEDNTSFND